MSISTEEMLEKENHSKEINMNCTFESNTINGYYILTKINLLKYDQKREYFNV